MLVSAEVDPFAKVGGLADVAGSLPKALAELGMDIRVIMPKYRVAAAKAGRLQRVVKAVPVAMPTCESGCALDMSYLPDSKVPIYFIEHDDYFDREGIYGPPGAAYPDNARRLSFFCRAALAAIEALDFEPDVIHLNDWHTSLIAAYCNLRRLPYATVFTAHNLGDGYQGTFPRNHLDVVGLDLGDARVSRAMDNGQINLARAGLIFADMINTVSRRYAEELRDTATGGAISKLIVERGEDVWGIINGIDYDLWSPRNDTHIVAQYDAEDLGGKAACKADLQAEFRLPQAPDIPLIGMVTRLDAQKGLDLVAGLLDQSDDFQLVLLGTGDPQLEAIFSKAAKTRKNIGARLEFSNVLARKVYAGADMFLMPSRYEPCGLGQMIALAYGTVPIVRRTGGLADTIRPTGSKRNGFNFDEYSVEALAGAIDRALKAYADPKRWQKLVANAFGSDYSWTASAKRYKRLYRAAIKKAET